MYKLFKVIIYIILFLIISGGAFFTHIYIKVSRETSKLIENGAIENVILSESPVYYDDGTTPIGVFFEKTHNKYISYDEVPRIYIKALIASEDKNFFGHHGFDVTAYIRAFISNMKAGKVVQGGSTITQLTAKNIFYRDKRTYVAKLKELIQAIQIENKYSKEKILEIFINQFLVTGFGRGLSVASEYFFNKEPKDLNLVEAAFIAGMVKGPSKYNPFTCKTEEEKKKAEEQAKDRKDYVLERMKLLQMITQSEYAEAKDQKVPFEEGRITYGLNVIMDYVRQQLESDYFRDILSNKGVENIATSGINIYTSISKTIQEGALNSLRTRLPDLDIQLSGYDNKLNKERYVAKMGMIYDSPMDNLPFFCTISGISDDINNLYIEVEWENEGKGIIDNEGLKPVVEAWIKWKHGSSAVFDKKYALEFLHNLHVGDTVPVMYRKDTLGSPVAERLFLWEIPDLEGGVVVLNNGTIKAMAGGFFDRHFNRAADAKRQLGSIFKPIVYAAALQLKWNNLDPLTNIYDLYSFENTYYIPRPDHDVSSSVVSMTWAGAKSENLASVWLLYHLTDRLNISEFKKVTELLGLARKESETYKDYVERIRDRHGVIVNEISLMDAAFEAVKEEIESDLIFAGNEKAIENLNRMRFDVDNKKIDNLAANDIDISRFSFSRLKRINSILKNQAGTAAGLQDVWVDGLIPSGVIDLLDENMNKRYRELMGLERYDIKTLYYVRDFRTLVNLFYVRQLADDMGISTPLDAVLSFPLGSNSVSILEAALVYNTVMTGKVYGVNEGVSDNMIPIITKITDRKGELIWEHRKQPMRILSDIASGSVAEILRMAVESGTASRAKGSVKLSMDFEMDTIDVEIPCFGKTGTSNLFSNSSFAGFIPAVQKENFSLDKGYVIASYVGYDDNKPMKGPSSTVYGASGALPIWIDTAHAIVNSPEYKKDIEIADLAFNINASQLTKSDTQNPVKVSPFTGLPLSDEYPSDPAAVDVYSSIDITDEGITIKRVFDPLKGVESDDQL